MEREHEIKVLDHGYVRLVDWMGTDATIIEAARMSTAKGFLGWGPKCSLCGDRFDGEERNCPSPAGGKPYVDCGRGGHMFDAPGDEKLLAFLYGNKHLTPFEMCELAVEVQAPIMVFREWHRHRTQSYNEMSARYTPLPDLNYIPTVERLMINAGGSNRQAGTVDGAAELTVENARHFRSRLAEMYEQQEALYQQALQRGVPKELARVHLPVGRYSRMRAKTDLRNWLAFLTLRMAPAAQWEIRQYANAVATIVKATWPRTYALFEGA